MSFELESSYGIVHISMVWATIFQLFCCGRCCEFWAHYYNNYNVRLDSAITMQHELDPHFLATRRSCRDSTMSMTYFPHLVGLMNFLQEGAAYDKTSEFTNEELLQISDDDICRYFKNDADDDDIARKRDTTILFTKKAISYFMPRKNIMWDPVSRVGNLTRSQRVNDVISVLKRKQVRKLGVKTQARRPLEYREFLNVLNVVRQRELSVLDKHRHLSVLTIQWHLLCRIDDTLEMDFDTVEESTYSDYVLQTKIRLSKNIREEKEAPTQIVLGSMDPQVCPLLNLAVYVEILGFITGYATHKKLFRLKSLQYSKSQMRKALKEVCSSDDFESLKEGLIGTHSCRKGPATYCARSGFSRYMINNRGRWRDKKSELTHILTHISLFPMLKLQLVFLVHLVLAATNKQKKWLNIFC